MARTAAEIPGGPRISDFVTLGVIAEYFPIETVRAVLEETGKCSVRERQLPAHVVVYYVIALALFMNVSYGEVLRCLTEGLDWMGLPVGRIRRTGRSGISQARARLGAQPLARLYEETVGPVAEKATRGAWYRKWRIVSLDGTTIDVADTEENEAAFGRPGASRGSSAFPQLRLVSLVENGTHVLFGASAGTYSQSEHRLARESLEQLSCGQLCLADRSFFGYSLWEKALSTGADQLWRLKKNVRAPCLKRFRDGSYLSRIYPSEKARRADRDWIEIRVIDYELEGVQDPEPIYRLATSILNPRRAPAAELAALYHQRWEIESAFAELKTHLRGRSVVLRSKTPELVRQELFGLLLAHFAVRSVMHQAALGADLDPDGLSFTHAVRVVRRKLSAFAAFPPSAPETTRRLHRRTP